MMDIGAFLGGPAEAVAPQPPQTPQLPIHQAVERWLTVPAWAGEMEGMFRHLIDTQPALLQVVDDLLDAFEAGDDDEFQEAVSALLRQLSLVKGMPQYPVMSKQERAACCDGMTKHLANVDRWPGGHGQALMVAMRQAAPDKYAKFQKAYSKYSAKLAG